MIGKSANIQLFQFELKLKILLRHIYFKNFDRHDSIKTLNTYYITSFPVLVAPRFNRHYSYFCSSNSTHTHIL